MIVKYFKTDKINRLVIYAVDSNDFEIFPFIWLKNLSVILQITKNHLQPSFRIYNGSNYMKINPDNFVSSLVFDIFDVYLCNFITNFFSFFFQFSRSPNLLHGTFWLCANVYGVHEMLLLLVCFLDRLFCTKFGLHVCVSVSMCECVHICVYIYFVC